VPGIRAIREGIGAGTALEVMLDVTLPANSLKTREFPVLVLGASKMDKLVAKFSARVDKALR